MSEYDSISLDSKFYRPSPFVSTSYEYAKSGNYTIGGVLLVTLSGTLVAASLDCSDIITQMNEIRSLDRKMCRRLIIGCSGDPTFLEGLGKVRSATATSGDQPCIASYSIVIAIETKADGKTPIVAPDPEFLKRYDGFTEQDLKGVGKYEERVSVQGEESNLTLVDPGLKVIKSYVKLDGTISVSSMSSDQICGDNTTGSAACLALIKKRYKSLMTASFGESKLYKKLAGYSSWQKWLDTKNIDINAADGAVTWSFSLIMTQGECNPTAFVDINTTDNTDAKTLRITKSIQGTIDGLSKSEDASFLKNGVCKKERLDKAKAVWGAIQDRIAKGTWPGTYAPPGDVPKPPPNTKVPDPDCEPKPAPSCYQRVSSSTTISGVSGRITFNAEFADIDSCTPGGTTNNLSFTLDETLPTPIIVEIIIPGQNSVLQEIGKSPHKVRVTVNGNLSGCDTTKIGETTACVNALFLKMIKDYYNNENWIVISQSDTTNTKSYSRTMDFMECK